MEDGQIAHIYTARCDFPMKLHGKNQQYLIIFTTQYQNTVISMSSNHLRVLAILHIDLPLIPTPLVRPCCSSTDATGYGTRPELIPLPYIPSTCKYPSLARERGELRCGNEKLVP